MQVKNDVYVLDSFGIDAYNNMLDMQYEFNCSIGKNHKLEEYQTYLEIYNLLQALSDEVVEAKNCFNWKWWSKEGKEHPQFTYIFNIPNYHIELIDMLHFILSLNIIVPVKLRSFIPTSLIEKDNSNINYAKYFSLECLLCEIQSIKYYMIHNRYLENEFKNGIYYNDSTLNDFLTSLVKKSWDILLTLLICYDNFSFREIYKMYSLKMDTNKNRQKNNYSVANKTEDDNKELYKNFK